ncbi:IS3 family transposase [Kosakonia oryzae]|nr:IS3 family transposase [Kosakonia oryzae]
MDRFFSSLKTEWAPEYGYANFREASTAITNYITGYEDLITMTVV